MAYTNTAGITHSNVSPGFLESINNSGVYNIDATPKYPLGTGFKRSDGSIYRYSSFQSAVAQGQLVSHNVSDLDALSQTSVVTVGTAATYQQIDPPGVYPCLIGSQNLLLKLSGVVANQFSGGYVTITSGTGSGYQYRVAKNTASATINGVANTVIVTLFEDLKASLDANTYVSVVGSFYNDLTTALNGSKTGANYVAKGATNANMSVGSFGWITTEGPAAVLLSGTVLAGQQVSPSFYTPGSVVVASGIAVQEVGWVIDPVASGYYANVWIECE